MRVTCLNKGRSAKGDSRVVAAMGVGTQIERMNARIKQSQQHMTINRDRPYSTLVGRTVCAQPAPRIPGAFHPAHAEGRGLYELPVLRCLWRPGLNGLGQGSSHSLRGGAAAARGTHPKVSGRAALARANAVFLLHVPAQCLFMSFCFGPQVYGSLCHPCRVDHCR